MLDSLYRSGSLTTAARELARYKLDLVGVQGRQRGGQQEQGIIFFSMEKKHKSSICIRIFALHRTVSAVNRV